MGRTKLEINPTCGIRLRTWLRVVGMSQKELALRLGYSEGQYISDIVRGEKRLHPDLADRIEHCPGIPEELVCNQNWLLCRSDCMFKHEQNIYEFKQAVSEVSKRDSAIRSLLSLSGYDIDYPDGDYDKDLLVFEFAVDFSKNGYVVKKDSVPIGRITASRFNDYCNHIERLVPLELECFISDSADKSNGSERNGENGNS